MTKPVCVRHLEVLSNGKEEKSCEEKIQKEEIA
jgi:hypothetical protein